MKRLLVVCAFVLVFRLVSLSADETKKSTAVDGNVRASFQVNPLKMELLGRRGQRIPFRFQIQVADQSQVLKIRLVNLKQQLNGLIVVDPKGPPPIDVTMSSSADLNLDAQEKASIEGFVDIPRSPTPFHAYGILVTDLGTQLDPSDPTNPARGQIGVRFVTRYLLRIEVQVTNGRQENAKQLRIETARLVEHNGLPFVESDIVNPTETNVEFQLYGRLVDRAEKEVIPWFGLALPVRAGRQEPDRYSSIVLGRSRVRLISPVPQAVFSGQYKLEMKYVSHRRIGGERAFQVGVRDTDFPAQASTSLRVSDVLQVSPSQFGLSLARGGNRRRPLKVSNKSSQSLDVKITAHNSDSTPANWVTLQPNTFQLLPGRNRNVLVASQSGSEIENHRYGYLRVQVGSEKPKKLPLALLGRSKVKPVVQVGQMSWDGSGGRPAFVVPVENLGPIHVPLKGRLTVVNELGQKVEIDGGFDRWLLPGERDQVRFSLHRQLPPATYQFRYQIHTSDSENPVSVKQQVVIQPPPSKTKALPASSSTNGRE